MIQRTSEHQLQKASSKIAKVYLLSSFSKKLKCGVDGGDVTENTS
jgi:hypothetical protein